MPWRGLHQVQTQLFGLLSLDGALTALGHVLRLDAHDACAEWDTGDAGDARKPRTNRGKAGLKSENLGSQKLGTTTNFHGCWLDSVP